MPAPAPARAVEAPSRPWLDPTTCYRAVESRDARFDGRFIVGVTTTGIYCRPSCPTPVRPKATNVRFFPTTAAAQGAGFRSCKRCRPDAVPGSPEWDLRADLVARAVRMLDDGVVDRVGVDGLADRLAVSARHLHRLLRQELGAGPLALARARRAQTARVLIETTDLPLAEVAFAAGFASIRQFNDTVRQVFDTTPSALRQRRSAPGGRLPTTGAGRLVLRLPFRPPLDRTTLVRWFAARQVAGIVEAADATVTRTLALPGGPGRVTLELPATSADPADGAGHVVATFELAAVADLALAVSRCRRLLDLDADPDSVDRHLAEDRRLAPLVQRRPGLRVPGTVDPHEMALLTIIGQQISTAAARTIAGRLVDRLAPDAVLAGPGPARLFPPMAAVADADLSGLGLPARRAETIRSLAAAVADGRLDLDVGCDRAETRARLLALPGVGPWTADYVALRALGDPDALPATDLVLRQRAAERGLDLVADAGRWRPWRAYAAQHLWAAEPIAAEAAGTDAAPTRRTKPRRSRRAAGAVQEHEQEQP